MKAEDYTSVDFETSFKDLSENTDRLYHEIKTIACNLRRDAGDALKSENHYYATSALYALDYINKILRGFENRNMI